MANDLTVHIVDDEETQRRSLTFLLISAGFAVRAHDSTSAFLDQLPVSGRACIVKVMETSRRDEFQLLERLCLLDADIPTIFVARDGDVATAVEAMKAGAADFIKMPFEGEVLITAIKRAATRKAPCLATAANNEEMACRLRRLTGREHQVLAAVLNGLQNKTIAFNLGISSRTVEVYRANVMAKMEARNLAELLRMILTSRQIGTPVPSKTTVPAMRLQLL